MSNNPFELDHKIDNAWCPACGNFPILAALKMALHELGKDPKKVAISSGIGQAAKTPQYLNVNFFNGLHGRAIPPATAIKASNPELTVIAESGDGDTYGEGGNHFIHGIRRNSDITNIVHNNMIYGLTKGQASPTSEKGMKTKIHVNGVYQEPFNPIAIAVAQDASFVARANIGDLAQTKDILKQAIEHTGYALVDIFQPCVVFNKINTYKWFKENTYYLPEDYDPEDRIEAFKKSLEDDKFPLGVIYKNMKKQPFVEFSGVYDADDTPLHKRRHNLEKIREIMMNYKR
jgi:2-oxoglutarate ferredoxin oxidoreductase subunit beta